MKVLIVKTSSLGDVIHTLPAITDATGVLGDIEFHWVVEEGFAEIPSWHPSVTKVLPVAIRRWRKHPLKTWRSGEYRAFRDDMRSEHYDAVIDAQGLIKSAWVTKRARGPKFGQDKASAREPMAARSYDHPVNIPKEQHAVERTRQLFAKALGYSVPEGMGRYGLDLSGFINPYPSDQPYVLALHATTRANKHWPEPYWLALISKIGAAGFRVRLLWANELEKARAERLAGAGPHVEVMPKMNLRAVAGVIRDAAAVVSVDTGLAHLTAALERPNVILYGPTDPGLIGAYGPGQVYLKATDYPEPEYVVSGIEPKVFLPLTAEVVWTALEGQLT